MFLSAQEAELQAVKDVEKQRLGLLRHLSHDAYKGVMWLRDNTDKFATTVHEPMMLNINVANGRYSKYFENTIASRDLCAFVCENKQDMNMLLKYLRDQQRLQVNCVHSDPNKNVDVNPKIPIERIAQFGFEYYLSSLINAPQTIIKYLVSMYRINNIPIGNDCVENNVERIPSSLNVFYSREYRFHSSFHQTLNDITNLFFFRSQRIICTRFPSPNTAVRSPPGCQGSVATALSQLFWTL